MGEYEVDDLHPEYLRGWHERAEIAENRTLRIRAGFDQTSKGIVSGSWTVEGIGYSREEVLAELDALSAEVLARVKAMNEVGAE